MRQCKNSHYIQIRPSDTACKAKICFTYSNQGREKMAIGILRKKERRVVEQRTARNGQGGSKTLFSFYERFHG